MSALGNLLKGIKKPWEVSFGRIQLPHPTLHAGLPSWAAIDILGSQPGQHTLMLLLSPHSHADHGHCLHSRLPGLPAWCNRVQETQPRVSVECKRPSTQGRHRC